jgi:serine/threonine protein kinase
MKSPDWDRIQEIYHLALAQPRSQRKAFVAEICEGDATMLSQLEALLNADDSPGDFLDSPVIRLDPVRDNGLETTVRGRYGVERKLSSGGMSHVYLARDQRLNGQPVVIKVLSQTLAQNSHVRKKFEHEVEAMLRIRHRNVVRVLDRGELRDGRPYIVMDYVDGEMLRSQITGDGMSLKRAASILKQIGEALEHVHDKGIFHRDLKPENIMLRRDSDDVVLIDFGIAKVIEPVMAPMTTNEPPIGTLLYMSPEHLSGKDVEAASDIYSMAVVAFEMIAGRRPFKATSAPELWKMQEAGVAGKLKQLREDISPATEKIIVRALSVEPQARYQNAREFGDELARALLPEEAPPPTISKRIFQNRLVLAAVSIVALVLLSYLVYRYVTRRTNPPIHPLVSNTRPVESPSIAPSPHAFKYWLTVQQVRDGKEYKSNGDKQTFESGDKFQLSVLSPESGYVYIINEGPSETNDTNVRMIYPNRTTNNGSAMLGTNQSIQSDWQTFRGPAGNDNFWIVWSVSTVTQLESAKNEAFDHPRGGLSEQTWVAVREFLKTKQAEVSVTVYHYKKPKDAVCRGKGDLLVTLAQFKHR